MGAEDIAATSVQGNGVTRAAPPAEPASTLVDCIAARQNTSWSLQLLAAQRQLYTEAKRWRRLRAWSVAAVAIVGVAATLFAPELLRFVGAVGAALALVQWLAGIVEKQRSKSAANVQEQFDTIVLGLPWNPVLAAKGDAEDVIAAAARHQGDRATLANWYSIPAGVPHPLDVLLCQRTNLRWDAALRRAYANTIVIGLVALICTVLIIVAIRGLTLFETFLALLPSVGAVLLGAEAVRAHRQHSTAQLELKRKVEVLWERARTRPRAVRISDLRSLQDGIYQLRVVAPPVPDGYYWRKRDQFEREMHLAAQRMCDEARAVPRET
jgi:hypothetical protein